MTPWPPSASSALDWVEIKAWAAQSQIDARLERLAEATPTEQWETQRSTLHLMLKKHLTSQQWAQLEEKAVSGEILAMDLTRSLLSATAAAALKDHVDQLKRRLNPLLTVS